MEGESGSTSSEWAALDRLLTQAQQAAGKVANTASNVKAIFTSPTKVPGTPTITNPVVKQPTEGVSQPVPGPREVNMATFTNFFTQNKLIVILILLGIAFFLARKRG